ncbi:MAG: hypothetical protein AABZ49_00865 [Thermoproteota archaeon]
MTYIMIATCKKRKKQSSGALLLELLIIISLIAIILSVGVHAVLLSIKSNKVLGERDVANALASESLEITRAITEENWENIYSLIKSTQHYQTIQSGGKWAFIAGDETINMNNILYTRYSIIDNVSRDDTTRHIQSSYSSVDNDPSTQKITVTVSWLGGNPVVVSGYFFRWKNKVCAQTAWTTGGSGNTVKLCSDASYDTKDAAIDVTGGSLKLQ